MEKTKPAFITIKAAKDLFGLSRSHINNLRRTNVDFEQRCVRKISDRKLLLDYKELERWINENG